MSRRSRRPFVALAWIVAGLVALDLALVLSARQLEARFRDTLSRVFRTRVEVGDVSLSLLSGLHVYGLVVYGPSGERAIAIDEAAVGIDWRRLEPGEVRIEWPAIDLRVDERGKVSLLEALDPSLLEGDGKAPDLPRLIVRVNHASLRLRHATVLAPGQVVGVDDLTVDVRTNRDGIEVAGTLVDPLAKEVVFRGSLDARSGALSVDADIRKAKLSYRNDIKERIPPMFWGAWELLQMHGTGDIALRVRKLSGKPPAVRADIEVHEGGICCQKFPYPAKDVQGRVLIEKDGVPLHVRLIDLHGAREGGTFGCNGEVIIMPTGQDDLLDLHIWAKNAPVDAQLLDALPHPVDGIVKRFEPTGRGDALVRLQGRLKAPGEKDEVHITLDATTRDVRARFDGFPVPVELAGTISLRDFRFSFDDFAGTIAGGRVRLRGSASPEDVDVSIDVTGARADESLEGALLPKHRKIVEMIRPRGRVNARIDVLRETDPKDGGMRPTFRARITAERGLTARFSDFPYPLIWQDGVVKISPDGALIEGVRAIGAPAGSPVAVTVNGQIRADDVDGGGVEIFVDATHLPIDGTFREAAAPGAATIVATIGPESGEIVEMSVDAVVPRAGADLQLTVDALIEHAVIIPEALELPVHDIRGRLKLTPERLSLDGIRATMIDAPVTAKGSVGIAPGVSGTAVIEVRGLELDGGVEGELPEGLRKVYEMARPAGRLDARLVLTGTGGQLRPTVTGEWSRGGLLLSFFPLAATGLEGRIAFADGALTISDVKGRLGEATLLASGLVEMDPLGLGPPRASFATRVRALPLDARLVDAFPEANRATLTDLAWAGRADLDLRTVFDPRAAPGGLLSYVAELDIARGDLDVGLALEEIDATVRCHGSWPLERLPFPELEGGIDVHRALWKGQELSHARGRFRASERLMEVTALRGDFLGGIAAVDFYGFVDPPKLWGASARLTGGRVERWADRKFGGEKKASGRLDADVALVGVRGVMPEITRGEGLLTVQDGNLFELPAFVSILSALSLDLTTKPVFDEARIEMRFEDKVIRLPRIVFSSSAISFMGGGTFTGGRMKVRVTPELGRDLINRIPVLSDIWNWIKGNIIELELTGSPDDPKVRPVPLKMITDSARWLVEQGRDVFGGGGGEDGGDADGDGGGD